MKKLRRRCSPTEDQAIDRGGMLPIIARLTRDDVYHLVVDCFAALHDIVPANVILLRRKDMRSCKQIHSARRTFAGSYMNLAVPDHGRGPLHPCCLSSDSATKDTCVRQSMPLFECPLMAQSGLPNVLSQCPLSGVKQTWCGLCASGKTVQRSYPIYSDRFLPRDRQNGYTFPPRDLPTVSKARLTPASAGVRVKRLETFALTPSYRATPRPR
jgi:hypothetical protein